MIVKREKKEEEKKKIKIMENKVEKIGEKPIYRKYWSKLKLKWEYLCVLGYKTEILIEKNSIFH
jgi:hypothetical protein